MTTSAISSTSSSVLGDQYSSSSSTSEVGKEEFLTLLVTQLQYQDPLDPMDNTEFVTQLAQFSALESMKAIESAVEENSLLLQSVNNAYSTSMIGKEVQASGSSIYLDGTNGVDIEYDIGSDASEVKITIYDENGTDVKSITQGSQSSGTQTYAWDGKDNNGNTISAGAYTYAVSATDSSGSSVSVSTYASGVVDGVLYEDGVTYLKIGDDKISLSDIIKISEAKK